MAQHSTLPAASATAPAATKIKHGAGVGAAIGLAISWCIGLGLGATWLPANPNAPLFVAVGVVSTIVLGAICGAVIGWSIPVAETRTDSTATH